METLVLNLTKYGILGIFDDLGLYFFGINATSYYQIS